MLNFCDFIQVFVFTTNHHLKCKQIIIQMYLETECSKLDTFGHCNLQISFFFLFFFLFVLHDPQRLRVQLRRAFHRMFYHFLMLLSIRKFG